MDLSEIVLLRMGLSLRVIDPRGFSVKKKDWGGGFFVYNFFKGFLFFSKFFKSLILKSFMKKSSIARYCAVNLLDL